MASLGNFGSKVPGFDFMQGLMKSAGSALPGMGALITPTLDPVELDKRIDDLRTVQFWLEQNVKLIGASIQALEVQRMTLSALKNLNVQVGDLGEAMKLKMPGSKAPEEPAKGATGATGGLGAIDPAQWWNALTQQFSEIAAKTVKDSAVEKVVAAVKKPATKPARKPSPKPAIKAAKAAKASPKAAGKPAIKATRKA